MNGTAAAMALFLSGPLASLLLAAVSAWWTVANWGALTQHSDFPALAAAWFSGFNVMLALMGTEPTLSRGRMRQNITLALDLRMFRAIRRLRRLVPRQVVDDLVSPSPLDRSTLSWIANPHTSWGPEDFAFVVTQLALRPGQTCTRTVDGESPEQHLAMARNAGIDSPILDLVEEGLVEQGGAVDQAAPAERGRRFRRSAR